MKIFFFGCFFLPALSWAAFQPSDLWLKGLSMGLGASYFQTTANFTEAYGEFERLSRDGAFQVLENTLFMEYGFGGGWKVQGAVKGSYGESQVNQEAVSQTALTGLFLGGDKLFPASFLSWALHTEVFINLMEIPPNPQYPILTNGAHEMEVGGWVRYSRGLWEPYGYLGVRYRTEGLSSLLKWKVGQKVQVGSWAWSLGLLGEHTVIKDKYSDNPSVRDLAYGRANAGSYYFNSVNPSWFGFLLSGEYRWTEVTRVFVSYEERLNGQKSAKGHAFQVGLRWPLWITEVMDTTETQLEKGFEVEDEEVEE